MVTAPKATVVTCSSTNGKLIPVSVERFEIHEPLNVVPVRMGDEEVDTLGPTLHEGVPQLPDSGAGIVAGSRPQEEWQEIENKISDFVKVTQ